MTDAGSGERTALAHDVYAAILRGIIAGEYPARAWLKEREISERYSVSRVPVREALRRLELEGFVESSQNRGVTVSPITRTDINHIFDLRLCVEPFAAERAAERVAAGEVTVDRLRHFLDGAQVADAEAARMASLDFHSEVVAMSGNPGLIRALAPVRGRLEWIFRLTRDQRGEEHAVEHGQIFEAIEAGVSAGASALTAAHIEMGRAPILTALGDQLDD